MESKTKTKPTKAQKTTKGPKWQAPAKSSLMLQVKQLETSRNKETGKLMLWGMWLRIDPDGRRYSVAKINLQDFDREAGEPTIGPEWHGPTIEAIRKADLYELIEVLEADGFAEVPATTF